jgi:NAD(P)H-dependent flavin oxidoreductase YrpB (nitropropane dioxygenase family)
MLRTRLTELLGIKYPIIGGAMGGISTGEFTAAVSNAGGLGLIASVLGRGHNEEALRRLIRNCRNQTDKPFGVNIPLIVLNPETVNAYIDCCIEQGVKVIETAGQNPKPYADKIKKSGVIWLHKAATVRHAQSAERAGVDAVVMVGWETAGFTGLDGLGLSVLIPLTRDAVKIPVVAAGGVADGRGLAGLLALGADGVQIGTVLMVTKESHAHPRFKEWVLQAKANETTHIERSLGTPYRVLKNKAVDEILELERKGTSFEETMKIRMRMPKMLMGGDLDAAPVACGQVVGLVRDTGTVKDVIERIVNGAADILKRLAADEGKPHK